MSDARPRGSVRYDNAGRIVIVTGGASGIGQAIGDAFASSGAQVICADVKQPGPEPLASNIEFRRCDTSSDTDCREAAHWVIDRYGAVDVLVNNAAVQPKESYHPIDAVPQEVWDRMIAVNLSGYMQMAKYVLPIMKRQQSGVIVNIASGQAHRTAREVGVYGPIKSANVMQARQWGVEYAREGIRVVSVSPGAIDTPMVRANLDAQGGEAALANRHPLGRIGQPQEVAAAVLWLASPDASFITATDLEVDGGLGAFGAFADPFLAEASE
jgi:NAD(P)-dependent dehydrogenase (short-subunit alcohol dehydrogenase family)